MDFPYEFYAIKYIGRSGGTLNLVVPASDLESAVRDVYSTATLVSISAVRD